MNDLGITRRRDKWRQSIISLDFEKRTYAIDWWDVPMFERDPKGDDLVGRPIMPVDAPEDSNEHRWGAIGSRVGLPGGVQRFRGENYRSAQEWLPMIVPNGFKEGRRCSFHVLLTGWPTLAAYDPNRWRPMEVRIDPRDYNPLAAAFDPATFRAAPAATFDPEPFRPARKSTAKPVVLVGKLRASC